MRIEIKVSKGQIVIRLIERKTELAKSVIADERRLFECLLYEIDKLLKKAKVRPQDVPEVNVISDQKESFTTTRIAQTVAKTWNWAVRA